MIGIFQTLFVGPTPLQPTRMPTNQCSVIVVNGHVLFAGSEKSKTDTACTVEQQTESHNINKSLLVLGQSHTTILY